MSKVTMVKPAKGSGKFVDDATAKLMTVTKDANGREVVKRSAGFKGERFPRSKQFTRPYWSGSRRQWMVDMDDEELQKCVKAAKFRYPDSHHLKGFIETADIKDFRDPFFRHDRLNHLLTEGEGALMNDDPVMKIILAGMRAHPEFQVGDTANPRSSRVKYTISDRTVETDMKAKEYKEKDEAVELLKKLTYPERKKVARALYLSVTDEAEPEDLEMLLRNKIEENDPVGPENLAFRRAFIIACKMPKEKLGLKDMIQRARRASIIRKKKDGYEFMGSFIGKRIDSVEKYFEDPENSEFYIQLERLLNEAESVR